MRYLHRPFEALTFEPALVEPPLSEKDRSDVRRFFEGERRSNRALFDGPILTCVRADIDDERALFTLASSTYAPYAWARRNGVARPGLYAVGTNVMVFERSCRCWALFARGDAVLFDRARLAMIGGVATPPEFWDVDLAWHLRVETARELDEEVAFPARFDPAALDFVGAYLDEPTLKLELLFCANVDRCSLAGQENSAIVRVPSSDLARFFAENEALFEASSAVHLSHVAGSLMAYSDDR